MLTAQTPRLGPVENPGGRMFFFQYISARRFSLRSETLALARSVPAVAFFLFKRQASTTREGFSENPAERISILIENLKDSFTHRTCIFKHFLSDS